MERIAFQMRLKPGAEEEYDAAHRRVWPELLAELADAGVREYSIFRRGTDLFFYLLVPDFQKLLAGMDKSTIDRRWQETMAPFFEPIPSLAAGESFAMMQEVFYMQGRPVAMEQSQLGEKDRHGR